MARAPRTNSACELRRRLVTIAALSLGALAVLNGVVGLSFFGGLPGDNTPKDPAQRREYERMQAQLQENKANAAAEEIARANEGPPDANATVISSYILGASVFAIAAFLTTAGVVLK
mmetsp:Transcript_86432/g.241841  ORF Transcript_86432/g.241841 Transcript_86432/m.241841 type:complete len:117 (+) Transcript_86432:75-425(+)|eukprot:CAMPEP_0117547458 /NCGR_PEP_ID=MMETSP0784-20121206/47135_1 /TAXON_ID=39447 /ORGANISM="" /LENGTH=116 /DNA_ID=CAMNT_0005344365 /DNA_START=30 /DNA_END=380 /DNA_ORIENTATION=+